MATLWLTPACGALCQGGIWGAIACAPHHWQAGIGIEQGHFKGNLRGGVDGAVCRCGGIVDKATSFL
jgi:hypothetical protein